MQIEPTISFHNLEQSDAVEEAVRNRVDELEQFFAQIITCRAKDMSQDGSVEMFSSKGQ